jgi:putative Ca2+/H+ antiporter (TMEM165/GDT1 family)
MDWQLFCSIFALIFVAELPDKTALATVLLATKGSPFAVFVGVAGAFIVQSLVAVLFGSVIGLLPAPWVHLAAGLLFFVFAYQAWRRKEETEAGESMSVKTHTFAKVAWSAFIVIFIAEWGDLTQLATASMAAKYAGQPYTVFFAATLALWSVTAVAITVGNKAKNLVSMRVLNGVAAGLFTAVGLYFVVDAIRHFP